MVVRFGSVIKRFNSVFSLAKRKAMEQHKCYFRYIKDEDRIDINFLLKVKEDNVRQFNFSRRPSETLESVLHRIGANIQKVLVKSKKKGLMETKQLEVSFTDEKGVISSKKQCLDLFSIEEPVKMKISDILYDAVFNPPWVLNLSLPRSILAGFSIYPEHLSIQNNNPENTVFNWYRGDTENNKGNKISDNHIKWQFVASGFSYVPTVSDIGMKIKVECVPGNSKLVGPPVECISSSVVEAGPGKCPFENRHEFTKEKLSNKSFRCVSYNILADLYCDSDYTRTVLHPYCPPYALEIDYRKQLIIKELLGYNSDIICLQEVDRKIFNHCLEPLLLTAGFNGHFYKKDKEVAEGLAIFYQCDRFRKIKDEQISISKALPELECLKSIWDSVKNNEPLLERLLDRSTVASATVLQSLDDPDRVLVVGNTHLYFHPDADHIRLLQGGSFIYWINDLVDKLKQEVPDKTISLILCGDYNSVPSCGIYSLFTTGVAPDTLPDWQSNAQQAVRGATLRQGAALRSACGTPPFTNFTAGFADCLDYIFYDANNLSVEQVIPFPSVEELTAHTALPSIVFPSDHIALIADLSFNR